MSVNITRLVELVSEESGFNRVAVQRVIHAYQDVIARKLAAGERVMQSNFLSIEPVERGERLTRNPQTGEPILVPAKRVVRVIVSERLQELVSHAITEVDGQPVTLRKLPRGAVGVMPIVTAIPEERRPRVKGRNVPRRRPKRQG